MVLVLHRNRGTGSNNIHNIHPLPLLLLHPLVIVLSIRHSLAKSTATEPSFRCRHPSWMTSVDMKCLLQTGPLNYQILMSYKMKPHFSWNFTVCKMGETYGGLQHTKEITIRIIPLQVHIALDKDMFIQNNNVKQILRIVVAAKRLTINCKHLQENIILSPPPFLEPGNYHFLVWSTLLPPVEKLNLFVCSIVTLLPAVYFHAVCTSEDWQLIGSGDDKLGWT